MYLSDMHTHSIASGHGTGCTISEMAKAASAKGLKLLGITDHGPATLAAGTPSYFRSLTFSPRKRFGLEMFYGIELNILDKEGHTDLDEELLSRLDYAIASIHAQNYKNASCEENTEAYINAMKNPHVKILGHCDNPRFPADYEKLAFEARKQNVIFEIMKPLWRLTATAVILGPTTGKFSAAAENMIFLFFFPATATAKNMWGILLMPLILYTRKCFPKI